MDTLNIDTLYNALISINEIITDAILKSEITRLSIYIIFIVFLLFIVAYCIQAIFDIVRLKILLKKIDRCHNNYKITKENIEEFRSISKETKIICSFISEYNGRYYTSQDMHIIIASLISPRIIKSKLFPTGASLLTGFGVLGTFVGLLIGLSGLELDGNNLDSLRDQIKQVTSGASTAFATSIVGVLLSLILNFIGKGIISKLSKIIYKIESLLGIIFPYYPIISVFSSIQDDSRETTDILGGLAEKIGDNMQKSINNLSDNLIQHFSKSITDLSKYLADSIGNSINETITKSLVPSVNKISEASIDLASRQASGSEDVMKNLIDEFTTKISAEGTNQRDAIMKATDNMKNCMIDFSNEMNKNLIQLSDFFEKLVGFQNDSIYENDKRSKIAQDKLNDMMTSQGVYLEKISNIIESHVTSTKNILNQGTDLQEKIEHDNVKQGQNLKEFDNIIQELKSIVSNLVQFSASIENSINKNSEITNSGLKVMSKISNDNSSIVTEFKNMLSEVASIRASLKIVTSNLDSSINKSKESFETLCTHYRSLQKELKKDYEELNSQNSSYVKKINEQVSKLLTEYGNAVQTQLDERMQEWNRHTHDYCDKMIEVANAFQDIIDRMDQIKIK